MSVLYVGKIVHYHSYGTPNGEYTPEDRAAIITEILPEGRASLCVLNPTGVHLNQNVPFAETPTPGHWNYIPDVADDTIPTSTVEQVTQVLPDPNAAPTLDTTIFPDEDAEYNDPTATVVPTAPGFVEEEICGMRKYVSPIASPGSDQGDYCVKDKGHEGDHESWSGMTWPSFH